MGSNGKEHRRVVPRPPPLSLYIGREQGEVAAPAAMAARMLQQQVGGTTSGGGRRILSKQLSLKETTREVKWEKRRRQIQRRRSSMALQDADQEEASSGAAAAMFGADGADAGSGGERAPKSLTDEDLDELKGSMELGFGFDEGSGGQNLCDTLPALDLYFAVNRQLSEPRMRLSTSSLPSPTSSSSTLCGGASNPGSPVAPSSFVDSWKICSPGDNPQLVKTRLRHWAQVVACSVKHSS
ncbi:uncharacterized protein LOC102717057 [Oryza brachyantha]|uniref:Uncharacterized protein n=1 Tax=Oryza brachyantha TaxID=4533 RepID=J3LWF9_ORYBR|nr:uncharacterized protein LOC102717057 [Oryza brachyantha]